MSLNLYHRRLYYRTGQGGVAKEGPVQLELLAPPVLFPGATEIDYGESFQGEQIFSPFLREGDGYGRRDMTQVEVKAVREYLHTLLEAVLTAAKVRCN